MDRTTPAIRRAATSEDYEVPVISETYNTIQYVPGWGDSGSKVAIVEHKCPLCAFDRMAREERVSAEEPDTFSYWCLNPNCAHYLRDTLSYAFRGSYPYRTVDEPRVTE